MEAGKVARFSLLSLSPFLSHDSIERKGPIEDVPQALLRHLAAVVHVNTHDLAAVLPLARHEVEVRLVRLCRSTRRIVQALGALVMIPAILSIIARLNGRRVPGAGCTRQTVGRPGADHPVGTFDSVGTVDTARAVTG